MPEHETCSACSQRLDAEDQLFEQADEIERLQNRWASAEVEIGEQQQTIERLRAALERLRDHYGRRGFTFLDDTIDEALQEGES